MIWHKLKDRTPLAYQTGDWDGKKSDKVLVCALSGKYYVAEMYEGVIDGNEFCRFYDINDFEIQHIAFWTEIDSPF